MTNKTLLAQIKQRSDTAANWTAKDPVISDGELIVVTTNAGEKRFKVGDGEKTFTQLPYTDERILNNVVTSVNGQTGDVTLDVSGGGGNMKKLTFTGGATGEYDGSNNVSVAIPEDRFYILNIGEDADKGPFFTNDYNEAKAAYESGKILCVFDGETLTPIVINSFGNTSVDIWTPIAGSQYVYTWYKNTKQIGSKLFSYPMYGYQKDLASSGAVYWNASNGKWEIKDIMSTTYKAGNGISISDDGTISVTAAKIYSGTSNAPSADLGENGDIYIQTEG